MFQWQHMQETGQHQVQGQYHAQETRQNHCNLKINTMQHHGQETGQGYMLGQHHMQEAGQNHYNNINSMQHNHMQEVGQNQRNVNSMQWAARAPQVCLNEMLI